MSIIERQVAVLRRRGIGRIHIVVGYMAEQVIEAFAAARDDLHFILNPGYRTTNSVTSLAMALPFLTDDFVYMPADLIFGEYFLAQALAGGAPAMLVVDCANPGGPEDMKASLAGTRVLRVGRDVGAAPERVCYTGVFTISGALIGQLRTEVAEYLASGKVQAYTTDVLNSMIGKGTIEAYITDVSGRLWDEVDNLDDLRRVRRRFPDSMPAG